jgi:O-antigen ligase
VDPDLSGSAPDRALLIVLIVLGLVVLGARARRTKQILACNKALIVLFIYMALSVLWSNFPGISLRRYFRSVGTLVMVLVVLTEREPLDALRALLRRLYLVHIPLSIATIKYVRNIGVAYTWDGVQEMWVGLTMHKNNLGQVAMCSGLLSTWQILRHWATTKVTLDLLLLVLTLWVLAGSTTSHSAAAILGFTVGLGALFGSQLVRKRTAQARRIVLRGTMILMLSAAFGYFVLEALHTSPVEVLLQGAGRDATLSDRVFLWQDLLNNAAKNPVIGVGFGAFWVGRIGYALYPFPNWSRVTHTWRPAEGHNGYIDVYVDLGLIGLALVIVVIVLALDGALNDLQNRFELGRFRVALLLGILTNNVAESSLLNGTHSLWFLFLLVAVHVPTQAQRLPAAGVARRRLESA